jgi:hypothetical protein
MWIRLALVLRNRILNKEDSKIKRIKLLILPSAPHQQLLVVESGTHKESAEIDDIPVNNNSFKRRIS